MDPTQLNRMSLEDLQRELMDRGLNADGKKYTLVLRLRSALEDKAKEEPSSDAGAHAAGEGGDPTAEVVEAAAAEAVASAAAAAKAAKAEADADAPGETAAEGAADGAVAKAPTGCKAEADAAIAGVSQAAPMDIDDLGDAADGPHADAPVAFDPYAVIEDPYAETPVDVDPYSSNAMADDEPAEAAGPPAGSRKQLPEPPRRRTEAPAQGVAKAEEPPAVAASMEPSKPVQLRRADAVAQGGPKVAQSSAAKKRTTAQTSAATARSRTPRVAAGSAAAQQASVQEAKPKTPREEPVEDARVMALRGLAADLSACKLRATLKELDVALAQGTVGTKLMADLEANMAAAIQLIESQLPGFSTAAADATAVKATAVKAPPGPGA